MLKRSSLLGLALYIIFLIVSNTGHAQTETTLSGLQLVKALKQGGYVIFFRHTATDWTQRDTYLGNLENCETQRNLSEKGREDAKAIGQALLALGIPIGQVLASPYCRTRETAKLAFGRVEPTFDLVSPSYVKSEAEKEQLKDKLRNLLSTIVPEGTNTILVAHGFSIRGATELTLAEGEAAVFKPMGKDGFKLIGRILPEEWAKLVKATTGP